MKKKIIAVLFGVVLTFSIVTGLTTKDEESYTLTDKPLVTENDTTTLFVAEKNTSEKVTNDKEENTKEEITKEEATTEQETTTAKKWTITDMDKKMYSHAVLRVRSGPDTSYEVVGSYKVNEEVIVTGKCEETGWYRVKYNGYTAYASSNYIGEDEIETEPESESESESES